MIWALEVERGTWNVERGGGRLFGFLSVRYENGALLIDGSCEAC